MTKEEYVFKEEVSKLFKLKLKITMSDMLLVLGIIIVAAGIYLIYLPAAIIFSGAALVVLAFLIYPQTPTPDLKKGGD